MNMYKKVEAVLYNYNETKAEIKNLDLEIESLENGYKGIVAMTYEEKSTPTNKFNSSVENEVVNKDEQLIKLRNIKRFKEIQIEKIDNALNILDERDYEIIKLRYISGKKYSWFQIAEMLRLSDATCRLRRGAIIKRLSNVIFT
ncbi:sigma factor-like helix-turn-helix DNA-binding protein [Clostridium sediminicola]|uniref:RNA polymerase subunit sigma n=1 Tax=Clostridium sediminicola TaxID=3114879 RepID=UPI0031F2148A